MRKATIDIKADDRDICLDDSLYQSLTPGATLRNVKMLQVCTVFHSDRLSAEQMSSLGSQPLMATHSTNAAKR